MSKPRVKLSIKGEKKKEKVQIPKLELYLEKSDDETEVVLMAKCDGRPGTERIISIDEDGLLYRWGAIPANMGLQLTNVGEIKTTDE